MAYKIKHIHRFADFKLPIEQAVYVPTTDKFQHKIDKTKVLQRVKETETYMADKFGGFTEVKGEGGYVMKAGKEKNKLVKEDVVKVTAFSTKKAYSKNKTPFKQKLRKLGKEWGQESIGYEHEGDLTYLQSEDGEKKK